MNQEISGMEEGEKKAGGPDRKIIYAVIAFAVVILAVVIIAEVGFNVNLLSPSSGEMAIAKPRPVVTPAVTLSHQVQSEIAVPVLTTMTPAPGCYIGQGVSAKPGLLCSGVCSNVLYDRNNCGDCGIKCGENEICNFGKCYAPDLMSNPDHCGKLYNKCPTPPNTVARTCYQGQCSFSECMPNHRFCGDYEEGCVPMYNIESHCGSCNKVCGADQWCNRTYCESGPKPGNCEYINCPNGLFCSHNDDGTPKCVPFNFPGS